MNAHCGRSVGGIRREMLDHVLIVGGAHARHVLAARQRHCNAHRPHRSRPLRRRDQVQWPLRE
ncbi:transposase [Streptomyces viridosporus]|nr:transposase [Streptomyces viridosporus]